MTSFAILRVKKYSALAPLAGVARHHCRQSSARGVDAARSSRNLSFGAARSGPAGVTAAVQSVLDVAQAKQGKKFRQDGVKAVEYMLTASPEWWKSASSKYRAAFFDQARRWLRAKHGAGNVVAEWVHLDERSPHLHVVVVPLYEGRPNARHFLGGAQKLSALQDEFAGLMHPLGLQRGTRNGKGSHLPVADWWAVLDKPAIKPTKTDYLRKVAGLAAPRIDQAERQAAAFEANKRALGRLRSREAASSKAAANNALEAGFLAEKNQKLVEREARLSAVERENLALREKLAQLSLASRPGQPGEGYFTSLGLG